MSFLTQPRTASPESLHLTLAGQTEALEREIDQVALDSLRIWDLRLSPGESVLGMLKFSDGVSECIRGKVLFSGMSDGREFSTITLASETWEGFLALVRHRGERAKVAALRVAA